MHGLAIMHRIPTSFCCPPARPQAPLPPRSPCEQSAWGQGGGSCGAWWVYHTVCPPAPALAPPVCTKHTLTVQHQHHPPGSPAALRPQIRARRTCQSRPGRRGVASLRQGSEGCAQDGICPAREAARTDGQLGTLPSIFPRHSSSSRAAAAATSLFPCAPSCLSALPTSRYTTKQGSTAARPAAENGRQACW